MFDDGDYFTAARRLPRTTCACGRHTDDAEHARAAALRWRREQADRVGTRYPGANAATSVRTALQSRNNH